jgi:DNA-binding response OmpR family regulator
MAGMNGVPLLKQVRERWPMVAATPVVLITLRRMTERRRPLCRGLPFLEKPFDLDHLVLVIQVAQNRSELRHRVRTRMSRAYLASTWKLPG